MTKKERKKLTAKERKQANVVRDKLLTEKQKREQGEINFGLERLRANHKMDYIRNLINGRYYLARCNMLADQIINNNVQEELDGMTKSLEYIRAEYALMKMQAIDSMRKAHFARKNLLDKGNLSDYAMTEKEIDALEDDYYNGKIIREEYDGEYEKKSKAEFTT